MKKIIILPLFLGFFLFFGCVSKSKYKNAVFHLEQSNLARARITQENDKLASEIERLEYRNAHLQSALKNYEDRAKTLENFIKSSKNIQNKAITESALTRQNLQDKLNIKDLEIEALRIQNLELINRLELLTDKQYYKKEVLQK
ncbi:MAG: hypothetical protein FWG57_02870 [Endomicrobia bacterium]|nr:hypothetical protein [Bacillota bacterium]MCL1971916.1 hypothetical protein [Endomicrobiia bacterium]